MSTIGSSARLKKLVNAAKEQGYPSVSLVKGLNKRGSTAPVTRRFKMGKTGKPTNRARTNKHAKIAAMRKHLSIARGKTPIYENILKAVADRTRQITKRRRAHSNKARARAVAARKVLSDLIARDMAVAAAKRAELAAAAAEAVAAQQDEDNEEKEPYNHVMNNLTKKMNRL